MGEKGLKAVSLIQHRQHTVADAVKLSEAFSAAFDTAIDFPVTAEFTAFPLIFLETNHIRGTIAKKESNFVRKRAAVF